MATLSDDKEFYLNSISNYLDCDDFIEGCSYVEDALTLYKNLKESLYRLVLAWANGCLIVTKF